MNYRDNFIKVLNHETVFPVPFSIKFTDEAKENYKKYLGRDFETICDTGSYVIASHTNSGWKEVKPGYFKDYYGVVWNKTVDKTLGIVEDPPLNTASFKAYNFPETDNLPVYKFIKENKIRYPNHFHMLSLGFALFERAWSLAGMEKLLIYFLTEPDFVHELLDKISDYNIKVIKKGAAIGGIDCVHFGDDWGSQNDLLISKELWREFIKPRFKEMCRVTKELGLYVSLHSCGKVDELIPEMIECGVDVFDPFQPEVMDIWKLHEEYCKKITFWGGLSVQKTLPYGNIDDVRTESIKLLKEMAPGGGYIFSPSHSLTGDIPAENIKTLIDLANNQTR